MRKRNLKLSKIILSLTCVVCFLLSAVSFAVNIPSKAMADDSTQTLNMTIEKTTFEEGEAIFVTPTVNTVGGKDWVGIVPITAQNKAIYWRYVDEITNDPTSCGLGSGVKFDLRLAFYGGDTVSSYKNLPAGVYSIIFVTGDRPASEASQGLIINIVSSAKSTAHMSVTKTHFYEGESIMLTPTVTTAGAKDWVGISVGGDLDYKSTGSIKWSYIDASDSDAAKAGAGSGVAVDVLDFYQPDAEGIAKYRALQAGTYTLLYVPNNGYAYSATETIEITIHPNTKTEHLSIGKSTYFAGEPIMVTPTVDTAKNNDWIGITKDYSISSIRWIYVDVAPYEEGDPRNGSGNNVAVDIRKGSVVNNDVNKQIPAGEYQIVFGKNDSPCNSITECLTITVVPAVPPKPSYASLTLDNAKDGLFEGTMTVKCSDYDKYNDYQKPAHIAMKWADANGKPLSGYSELARRKVTSANMTFKTYDNVIIPANAEKLLVYFVNEGGEYSESSVITLPSGSQYKNTSKLVNEFNIISDVHIKAEATQPMNRHYQLLLKDIAQNMPNSSGIFVNGDIVDYGEQSLYTFLVDKYKEAKATYPNLPNLYAAMGNHELFLGSEHAYSKNYQAQLQLWLSNVSQMNGGFDLPDDVPYYDMWIDGLHYIFLGSESTVDGRGHLSDKQLAWLKTKLNENRTGNPIFLFLHQGLSDTVAGTMKSQGWHGVCAGDEYLNTNDHSSSGLAQREKKLRDLVYQYPEIQMFAGHSHWYFNAQTNILDVENGPTFVNTASSGYLWNDYDIAAGEYLEGSQGYYVKVYEDRIEYFGRNFNNSTWASSAMFVVYTHSHNYEQDFNAEEHFDKCSCGDIINRANHVIVNGVCKFCDYELPHEHSYTDAYLQQNNGHIGICACGAEGPKQNHTYIEGVCVCGATQGSNPPSSEVIPDTPENPDTGDDTPDAGEDTPNDNTGTTTTGCALGIGANSTFIAIVSIIALAFVTVIRKLKRKNI